MDKAAYLSARLSLPFQGVKKVLELFAGGGTVPFIARYRREQTGNLDEHSLRAIEDQSARYDTLAERKQTVVNTIAKAGKMTSELQQRIDDCDSLATLEDLYRPYRPKRETRGQKALKAGLEPLLDFVVSDRTGDLATQTRRFVGPVFKTPDECLQGALDIWAERIADNPAYRAFLKRLLTERGAVRAQKNSAALKDTYDYYDKMTLPLKRIRAHQAMALERGHREKCLRIVFEYPETLAQEHIEAFEKPQGFIYQSLLVATVKDALSRLVMPSVENDVWGMVMEQAETESLRIFGEGVRDVLMFPPLTPQTVMGFDPGFAHGCKIAVVSGAGNVLATAVVYPTLGAGKRKDEAAAKVAALAKDLKVGCVALGNGTATRESAAFLSQTFGDAGLDIPVYPVSESGASVYSATPLAEQEFPDFDVNLRSAVSIARRLQDPLSELVKIPPEALGVGQYQHDLDGKRLAASLGKVVEDCVNNVGVNANTASPELLAHISGISPRLAQAIVDYRNDNGPFPDRKTLLRIKGLGPKVFLNAAGFLRVRGAEPLDDTFIHPESYDVARKVISLLGIADRQGALAAQKAVAGPQAGPLATQLGTDVYTLNLVLSELAMPHRDPRGSFAMPRFSDRVAKIADLKVGMVLEGTVRNIAAFGAFVDLGLHKDGLVHVSEIAPEHVDDPYRALRIGQVVKVEVLAVDVARERISLSIKRALGKETSF